MASKKTLKKSIMKLIKQISNINLDDINKATNL